MREKILTVREYDFNVKEFDDKFLVVGEADTVAYTGLILRPRVCAIYSRNAHKLDEVSEHIFARYLARKAGYRGEGRLSLKFYFRTYWEDRFMKVDISIVTLVVREQQREV